MTEYPVLSQFSSLPQKKWEQYVLQISVEFYSLELSSKLAKTQANMEQKIL